MKTSEQINELITALAKARVEMPQVNRTKRVEVKTDRGRYDFWYAPLEEILASVYEPLAGHGLVLVGGIEQADDGAILVITRLAHASGQWIESAINVGTCVDERTRRVKLQEMGSAITYGRRYGVCTVLGIQADDDDDANAAEGNTIQRSEQTRPVRRPANPDEGSQDPSEVRPSASQVDDLLSLGMSAYSSKELLGRAIRTIMGLSPDTKITKKFLMAEMVMTQYMEAYSAFEMLIKRHVEGDVQDFPAPGTDQPVGDSSSSTIEDPTGIVDGETGIDTPDAGEMRELMEYADTHGLRPLFDDNMKRWPDGMSRSAYDRLKANMEWRVREQARQRQAQEPVGVHV